MAIKSAHIIVLYLVHLLEAHASYWILLECGCIFGLESLFLKISKSKNRLEIWIIAILNVM